MFFYVFCSLTRRYKTAVTLIISFAQTMAHVHMGKRQHWVEINIVYPRMGDKAMIIIDICTREEVGNPS